jgi:hypothetical protein
MIEFKHGIFSLLFVSVDGQSHAGSNEWAIDHVSRFEFQRFMCKAEAVVMKMRPERSAQPLLELVGLYCVKACFRQRRIAANKQC